MSSRRLHPKAWVALLLTALFNAAEALCSVFVSVYLWINSHDFNTVCVHFMALYVVTPVFFILAGWYSQARDRIHVYRAGLILHALFYAALLVLREESANHAAALGVLRGVAWGVFYAGANTINYDVSTKGKVEYFVGLLQAVGGASSLLGPVISGIVIHLAPTALSGYNIVFSVVVGLYLAAFALSSFMPSDEGNRPFYFWRALFPGKDQRDWRLFMAASFSMAGSFNIFDFLLGLLMYQKTGSELSVGGFATYQTLAGILVSFVLCRIMEPRTRRNYLFWGMLLLVAAGIVISSQLTLATLIIFGFMRSVSGSMFGIAHFSMRMETIAKVVRHPAERIEYLCAWEVPLALGRVMMMTTLILLWNYESEFGIRITLFLMCAIRIVTYLLLSRTSVLREAEHRA